MGAEEKSKERETHPAKEWQKTASEVKNEYQYHRMEGRRRKSWPRAKWRKVGKDPASQLCGHRGRHENSTIMTPQEMFFNREKIRARKWVNYIQTQRGEKL